MKKIDVVFCFDENQWMQAGVAMASLLLSSKGKCAYNFYCVVSDGVLDCFKSDLKENVEKYDTDSSIVFIKLENKFNETYDPRHLSKATYFRLCIPELLPNLDKVIYCDVDVIFRDNLISMDKIDIGNNFIAGVKDIEMSQKRMFRHWYNRNRNMVLDFDLKDLFGSYINAGVLVMNLKEMRNKRIYELKWKNLLTKKFWFCDQDILNISCYKRIKYIDPKFNLLVHTIGMDLKCDYSYKKKLEYVKSNPLIIHYTSKAKPWLCETFKYFDIWWYFASKTLFFDTLKFLYLINLEKNKYLSPKEVKNNYYLFGFIPLFVKKICKCKIKYKLFNLFLLLKIKCK